MMPKEKEQGKKLREQMIALIKKANILILVKIARILGIPIMKDP